MIGQKIAEPGKAGMLQPPRPQDPRLHMPALHLAPDGLQQFAAEVIGQHAPQDDEIDIEQRLDVKNGQRDIVGQILDDPPGLKCNLCLRFNSSGTGICVVYWP